LITHDLGVVAQNADKIVVMYAGHVVEEASVEDLFKNPKHPYTKALLNVILDINSTSVKVIKGHPPSIEDNIFGCPFNPRCESCMNICTKIFPETKQVQNNKVACHLYS